MPRRPTEISQPDHISVDSTGPQKHTPVDRDLMVNWSCAYPPVQFHEVPCEDVKDDPQYYISRATSWNNKQVVDWALGKNLSETARTLNACRFNGQQLLHSDAVKLQNFGVSDGLEAIRAQECIRQIAQGVDRQATGFNKRAVYNYKELLSGDSTCPCYSVLSTLSTDPCIDNTFQILQMTSDESGELTRDISELKPTSKKMYYFRLFPTF